MDRKELYKLYCMLCDFLESCTPQERLECRDDILKVKMHVNDKMEKQWN